MPTTDKEIYLGLISGTSMDSIDTALVSFADNGPELIATHTHPWPDDLRQQLQDLTTPGENEINRLGQTDVRAGVEFASAALALLSTAQISPSAVTAIGSHGQTIRHQPDADSPFTLQIGDPSRIAEVTGITTVAGFRRRDMAAGGEGAPLVPAFHAAIFSSHQEQRCILNIGGIANITLLPPNGSDPVTGFDTGPGNCLLDAWINQHLQQPFDRGGAWAAEGKTRTKLLEAMLADSYFRRPAPKSTGVDYFNLEWLNNHLAEFGEATPCDIQTTLVALTAETIARAIQNQAPSCQRILVCGGGVHNSSLLLELKTRFTNQHIIESTSVAGLDPDWVEAVAFAWLAKQTMEGKAGNLPEVTGAKHPVILGGIYLKG
ncbi:Anhydro-N-acetylmuramic acid kinase [hydrothermal vent metagenome]|uniref:Anhydro-N-acetylmuramic acid kinase n=1 Tax=hydrothermal vent metagenome TaxID=652676 RepID=A0A3B1APF8_9ZZZZ